MHAKGFSRCRRAQNRCGTMLILPLIQDGAESSERAPNCGRVPSKLWTRDRAVADALSRALGAQVVEVTKASSQTPQKKCAPTTGDCTDTTSARTRQGKEHLQHVHRLVRWVFVGGISCLCVRSVVCHLAMGVYPRCGTTEAFLRGQRAKAALRRQHIHHGGALGYAEAVCKASSLHTNKQSAAGHELQLFQDIHPFQSDLMGRSCQAMQCLVVMSCQRRCHELPLRGISEHIILDSTIPPGVQRVVRRE